MSPSALRAARATGAMFFIFFGAAWLEYAAWLGDHERYWLFTLIAVAAAALLVAAGRIYSANKLALAAHSASPERRRIGRAFHIVNAVQWVVILLGVNVLNNIDLGSWDVPFVIFVIGLHFLPLAHLFKTPQHYVTGLSLVLLAVAYPFASTGGTNSLAGCVGAGVILWASALWAMKAGFERDDLKAQ